MDVRHILSQMTLEEKAALCQGADTWHTVAIERLSVPSMMMSDGPHGLRKQVEKGDNLGINDSIKAVCFPTAAGMACSFDRELMEKLGDALGQSCQAENLGVVLGPAANIKRSPLCGRNFEYFSEDPYLSGQIAGAYIRGVQRQGVGTSLKHFAANNQETRRMSVSAEIPEQTLREIYLASFEHAVKEGKPWTVMCSYNKIAGTYSSENPWLMNEVLRKEWGFDGLVMTDWGACNDHVRGVASGIDLCMPRMSDRLDRDLAAAVRNGLLDESVLDTACENLLNMVDRYLQHHREGETFDLEAQHQLARELAREAMVLLKNEDGLLPLNPQKKIAFIGSFAETPRFQGGGSSHINASEVLSALDAVKEICPVTYAQGFITEEDRTDVKLLEEAVAVASEADVAVLFLGLPDSFESEGYDREHMRLPNCQVELLHMVAKVQKNIVVVLHNGSPVEMPWIGEAAAVLEAYLGGQAAGGAVVDLLFGKANPCAKLAESFPLRLEDTPCYLDFPGVDDKVVYSEGVYVGYRYYDKRRMDVLFPFGHGLSYTTYAYSNLRLSADVFEGGCVTASVDVTNTGNRAGKEIVQLYIRPDGIEMPRPIRELKGFAKVSLEPGQTKTVSFTLDQRSFAYWKDRIHEWYVEPGMYVVEAAASSRDIRQSAAIECKGKRMPVFVTADSTMGDLLKIPGGEQIVQQLTGGMGAYFGAGSADDAASAAISQEMILAMVRDIPLHAFSQYAGDAFPKEALEGLIYQLNQMQGNIDQ